MYLGKLRENFIRRAVGAGMIGLAAITPFSAVAQDAAPTEAAVWTDELRDLRAARSAANEHASTHGAAVLLHVGMDIQNHPQREEVLAWVAETYKGHFEPYGIEIEVFPSMNDASATVLEYRIGPKPYTPVGQPDPILDLQTGVQPAVVADVAQQAALQLELAANLQPAAAPGG
ncbi:MAG: hypothetical protein AAF412_09135 [Pseudomonadota bacterium]